MTDAVCWAWGVSPAYKLARLTEPVPKRGHTKGIRLGVPGQRVTGGMGGEVMPEYIAPTCYVCARCGVVFSETEERDGS